ncbi:MAG TPA: alcohol dehydrogenase catalytic domain-containing protein [Acidimicrobiia bacterium]|nr:alcohol dehydrogenase catalytic domain-containing protein [Acidimicrobiia bacterium]
MRAAVLSEEHAFEVVDVVDPAPGATELVLRVDACGICGSDLKAYRVLPAGTVLGHEFCGEIVAVGTGVRADWREGQAVAAMPLGACGRCRWCLADEPAHCERVDLQGVGGSPGAFAEYVRVDAASALRLADGIGEHGALVEPLAVGLHTVDTGNLLVGDRALVIGGGNVGAAVSVWARRRGAAELVVSDPAESRRDAAASFGATGVHDPADGPPPPGFDVVFECVGAPGTVQTAIDAAGVHGRVVIAGVCMAEDRIVPVSALMKEVDLRFAVYYRGKEFAAAAGLLESGDIDPAAFVSGRVGLDGVSDTFEQLLSTTTERKILVRPNG